MTQPAADDVGGRKGRLVRLATTAVPMDDYLALPHAGEMPLDHEQVIRASRRRVQSVAAMFETAWQGGAKLVASYESVTGAGMFHHNPATRPIFDALVEPIPGPTTELIGTLARKHRAYGAICFDERDGGNIHNTAVLIGPDGQIVGRYRKVHLPPQERSYATPGDGFPVFETELGRIGFSICYDIMFPEAARCVAMNGADLLVHIGNATYTLPEESLRVRAAENMMWILAANTVDGLSVIIDPMGALVARASRYTAPVAWADVDLAMERPLPADNLAGSRSLRGRQCRERVPAAYAAITRPCPPLLDRYEDDPMPATPQEWAKLTEELTRTLRQQAAAWVARRKGWR